jgi:uncharacterized protein (DUF362 family)
MPTNALVALIRCAPATVLADFERLIELAQFRKQLEPDATLLFRPDARRHFPFPAANTTPWQLEGVARVLRAAGCYDLTWMWPRSHIANIATGEDLNGYQPILREYGVVPRHTSNAAGRITNAVLLPTLKTDAATTIGGALRCLADECVSPHNRAQRQMHDRLVGALAASREKYERLFAVMDGTTVGVGLGSYDLRLEVRNVLLASTDPLALDAVAARLLGFDPLRDIAYLRLAHERGLGVADPQAIELVGDIDLVHECGMFPTDTTHRLPAARPLFRMLIDHALERFRWSFAERPVFESWLRGTAWGRLFAHYQRLGYGRAEDQALPLTEESRHI